jgi:hypothetical protein
MSIKGVLQLQKIIFQVCDKGGSSKEAMNYIKNGPLFEFAKKNPLIDFICILRRGKHPTIIADYKNGRKHVRTVKNFSEEEIEKTLFELKSQTGYKKKKIGSAKVTQNPSIQGNFLLKN